MKTTTAAMPFSAKALFAFFALCKLAPAIGQVYGCRDQAATNYNMTATVNDGSCTYTTTTYNPAVKVDPISDTLIESSGLQWAGNALWSFNDGGGEAAIYRIDTITKNILQTVKLAGATNIDWEDIAFDGSYFYIGDFGNNANGARTNLRIYKVALSSIRNDYMNNRVVTIPATAVKNIDFRYADQPQPPTPVAGNSTKYDCEAMIVDGGKIHLFTKNWINNNSVHYVINSTTAGSYVAMPLDTLATGYLVTGADKSPSQKLVILLGYQNSGAGNHYMHILSDYKNGFYFNGNKRRISLPNALVMGQAEGITFRNSRYGYISNEKFTRTVSGFTITVNQKLQSFNISDFIPQYLSSRTDFFRTARSGIWDADSTWETSVNRLAWMPATETPDSTSDSVFIRNGHTVTINDTISIGKTIVSPSATLVVNSTMNVIDTGLVLKSDRISDARIATSTGSIKGDVMVERYIPAQRAWRLLNTPFYKGQDIYSAWQESQADSPGYGTHITGGSAANGFDQSLANISSIKYFDPVSNAFVPLSTTRIDISKQPGYFLFIRGDRTVDLSQEASAPATYTILRAAGILRTGDQIFPVAANGLTLIGNPFPSAINFAAVTKANVTDRFFVWDPKRATSGAYVLFEGPDYAPLNSGGSYNGANNTIQSGQAFFVQGETSAGTIGITESSKTSAYNNVSRTSSDTNERLQVNLYFVKSDTTAILADATAERYNNLYSKTLTPEDAAKPDNVDENIAIARDGKLLTIERRPFIDNADTVFLKIYNMQVRNYRLEIIPQNFTASALTAYLEDKYLKKNVSVSLTQSSVYNFSITADTASAIIDRFKIIYKTSSTLPINFTAVQGRQEDAGIQVEWKVAIETNIRQYEILRSSDARVFTKTATIAASQAANYYWLDKNPFKGNNFYQIKAVEYAGRTISSAVISVKSGNTREEITVYPNPVKDRNICLQFYNQPKGNYTLQLFNNAGQQVLSKTVKHPGGSITQTIQIENASAKGIYLLQINNGRKEVSLPISIE